MKIIALDRSFLLQMYALKINRIETGLSTEKDSNFFG